MKLHSFSQQKNIEPNQLGDLEGDSTNHSSSLSWLGSIWLNYAHI